MKKRFLSVVLASTMVLGLTACGGRSVANTDSGSDTLSDEDVTLTVWESEEVKEFIEKAGEAFTKEHPNITIKYVNVELGDSTSQIALDGPAGTGPDLFAAPHDKVGTLVEAGHVKETQLDSSVSGKIQQTCVDGLTYNDKMYGYPVSVETYALFYNKDLISEDEIPKTWGDMAEFGKTYDKAEYALVMA